MMAVDWDETTPINSENLNDDGVEAAYPVGSIYMNANTDENPETLLGFGTWDSFGEGRVLVGVDDSDSDFDEAEKTGGEKRHTLTTSEMPSHSHRTATGEDSGDYDYGENIVATPRLQGRNGYTDTNSVGDGNSHNNLQPYITVYMWIRTA